MSWPLLILTALVLGLSGISVSLAVYVMLVQPLLAAPLHGLRGLKRARARSAADGFRRVEPLMRWVAARISPFLSRPGQLALQQKITIAGEVWGLWPSELRALAVLSALGSAAIGVIWVKAFDMGWPYAVLLGALGFALPELQLSSTANKRVRAISRRLPHIVDLLVLSLSAGLDFPAALRQVVERSSDPESEAIEELGLVLEELKLGTTRRQALEELAQRVPCDEVRDLVAATVQSEEQGTPLAIVLGTQATTSRQRRSTRAEELASKASTALILPLVLIFMSLMILVVGPTVLDALRGSRGLGG
ncbi:MAG: type II secretion system F family protein [Polyangiales bacterium]